MAFPSKIKDTHWLVWLWISVYVVCSIVWHFMTDAPWDDDCVTRYFNTKNALADPRQFLGIWNRPLFVLLFVLPFQISQHMILLMVLLSATSSFLLYRIAKDHLKLHSAFVVVPFLLFQAFYYGVTRNALTEPLAAFLISLGLYAYYERKYTLMAVAGGLLPLARMELMFLLPVWIIPLIREKQWKALLIMALPMFCWNLAGAIADGELLWIVEKTMGKDKGTNRYGQKPFNHYFLRTIYVLGPTVFFFSLIGMLERIFRKRFDTMITVQLIVGFMVYVVFSWKLSLGNAAGFLRHLITLSPLFALLAARGFTYWWDGLSLSEWPAKSNDAAEEEIDPVKTSEQEFQQRIVDLKKEGKEKHWKHKKLSAQLKKAHQEHDIELDNIAKQQASLSKVRSRTVARTWRIILIPLLLLIITFFYFTKQLRGHHKLTDVDDMTNFWVVAGLLALGWVLAFFSNVKRPNTTVRYGFGVGIGMFAATFTLYTEPPNAHNSTERQAIGDFVDIYRNSSLVQYPLYVNHNYFFWAMNSSPNDMPHGALKKEELKAAPDSSIVIWESHYSHRLNGDVQVTFFNKNSNYVELFALRSEDNSFLMQVYMKLTGNDLSNKTEILNVLEQEFPELANINSARGKFVMNFMGDNPGALSEFSIALQKDPLLIDALLGRAFVYTKLGNFQDAITDYTTLLGVNDKIKEGWLNRGTAYTNLGQHEQAITDYSKALEIDEKQYLAYVNRAISYNALQDYSNAEKDLTQAAKLQGKNPDIYSKRAQVYQRMKEFDKAIMDLSRVLQLQPNNAQAFLVRGSILIETGRVENGCKDLQKALELGHTSAAAYIQQYCQ